VTDTFWCMEGPMVIETRAPSEVVELAPGQMYAVPSRRAHRVTGKDGGRCRFGILQGVGTYDFKPVGACCAAAARWRFRCCWPRGARRHRMGGGSK
jgi:hypothetical protein